MRGQLIINYYVIVEIRFFNDEIVMTTILTTITGCLL